jgi:hypothetical protein
MLRNVSLCSSVPFFATLRRMSNGSRRRDRWETARDSEVLEDVAREGLDLNGDCTDEMQERVREIAGRVAAMERAAAVTLRWGLRPDEDA